MKKRIAVSISCLFALTALAQQENGNNRLANIDLAEDTTEVTTIDDIIKVQQEVTSLNSKTKHFADVWSRKGYFNLGYNSTKLSPKDEIKTGVSINNGRVVDFKSDWGASLQLGRSYRLHKKPISNILQFYIDWTYIDLNVNHFKAEGNGENLYDSSLKLGTTTANSDGYYYTPWNLEKYEANYGMAIGPSLSVAPFNYTDISWLHFFRLNIFYHIGYNVSVLYMPNDKHADVNQDTSSEDYKTMSDNLKLNIGHGMTNSFGFSVSWKSIGIGYEYRSSKAQYKPSSKRDFGKEKYDFTSSTSRVFLQFRM